MYKNWYINFQREMRACMTYQWRMKMAVIKKKARCVGFNHQTKQETGMLFCQHRRTSLQLQVVFHCKHRLTLPVIKCDDDIFHKKTLLKPVLKNKAVNNYVVKQRNHLQLKSAKRWRYEAPCRGGSAPHTRGRWAECTPLRRRGNGVTKCRHIITDKVHSLIFRMVSAGWKVAKKNYDTHISSVNSG